MIINILVIGARGCGKTSFIRKALEQETYTIGCPTSALIKLQDRSYQVRLFEVPIDEIDFSSERRIIWPRNINGTPFPEVDAVFCLYDGSDKDSLADVPPALSEH
jgi:GTPase SAR1 family protein